MGYYSKKYSTLRVLLRWRTKLSAKKLVKYGLREKKRVSEINSLISQHFVSKGKKEIDKFTHRFENFFKYDYRVLIDEDFQEDKALEVMGKIENILLHIEKENIKEKTVQEFEKFMKDHLIQSIGRGETFGRKNYRELLNVIAQVEIKDHEKFMTIVKSAMKNMDISTLARFPFYRDIRKQQQDIVALNKVLNKLKDIENQIKRKNFKQLKKEIEYIESMFLAHKDPIYDAFFRAYAIKHRDFIYTLMALYDEAYLESILEEDVLKHLYPETMGKKQIEKLETVKSKFRKELQSIAQAERIFISKEQQLKGKAKAM